MNFFEHQEQARRRTTLLLVYYALAVALIIGTIYLVVSGVLNTYAPGDNYGPDNPAPLIAWNPLLFAWVAGGTLLVVLLGSAFKIAQLSGGGSAVAESLGGTLISRNTTDIAERRLLNVVEEIALASGVPVPPVYILEQEAGINAFAAGFTPSNAIVAVTRGTLNALTRDELQGVVAHEFSHILNGDMRLNIRLMGLLNGILAIAMIGYLLFRLIGSGAGSRSSSRDSKSSGGGGLILALALIGVALWIIGYVGVFFANLIKAAVSRQREFLADASAVQFTRNPLGIGGALKKIGGLSSGSRLKAPRAAEASHLYFANGLQTAWLSAFGTDPPLAERIRRIEPEFDGVPTAVATHAGASGQAASDAAATGFAGKSSASPSSIPQPSPTTMRPGVAADLVVESIGTLRPQAVEYMTALLARIPVPVREAVRTTGGARSTVCALLLDDRPAVRAAQLKVLGAGADTLQTADVTAAAATLTDLDQAARLPLADLAMPALKLMPAEDYPQFRQTVMDMVAADEGINLFEYALMRMLVRNLDATFIHPARRSIQYTNLRVVRLDCATLLATLAHYGSSNEASAASSYAAGMAVLFPGEPALPPPAKWSLEQTDKALDTLATASPRCQQALVQACVTTVSADGVVYPDEGALLRAVCDALGCPLPPMAAAAA